MTPGSCQVMKKRGEENEIGCCFRESTRPSPSISATVVDADIMPWTLDTILTEFTVGTSPLVRQATCVWLLSLLKHAGKHPGIQVCFHGYTGCVFHNRGGIFSFVSRGS